MCGTSFDPTIMMSMSMTEAVRATTSKTWLSLRNLEWDVESCAPIFQDVFFIQGASPDAWYPADDINSDNVPAVLGTKATAAGRRRS